MTEALEAHLLAFQAHADTVHPWVRDRYPEAMSLAVDWIAIDRSDRVVGAKVRIDGGNWETISL